jgi:cyclo(L-tyrosyl-L-tyrosyl) synthase
MDFTIHPYSENCRRVSESLEHCLVGLSPFNGYYAPRRVEMLVEWAARLFKRVDVLVPGFEAAHTLTAAGVGSLEAAGRARRAVNQLRNPAVRALARAGVMNPEQRVRSWTQLMDRSEYTVLREKVRMAYRTDPAVRDACRVVARKAVRNILNAEPDETQVDGCVDYPLAELPFVTDSPSIFDVPSSVFVYHRQIELAEPLLAGATTALRLAEHQGFVVAESTGGM